jgi:hypothetical protein
MTEVAQPAEALLCAERMRRYCERHQRGLLCIKSEPSRRLPRRNTYRMN